MKPIYRIFRRFALSPTFTIVALLTLALSIGANTAIFSVMNGVLIKPLPYPDPEALVGVWHLAPGVKSITGKVNFSAGMYFTYRDENRTFQEIGLFSGGGASVTGLAEPEQVLVTLVTYGVLQALGVQPVLGRWFSQADDAPGSEETVILTYDYWQRRFGADRSIVGRTINVDSRPRQIIGVMPRGFRVVNIPSDLILPQRIDRSRVLMGDFSFRGIARLKPGVSLQEANADVSRMLPIWLEAWPMVAGMDRSIFRTARFEPSLQPLKDDVVGDVGNVLRVLMGTIGMVLLIACANVANLLLVRAQGRQQELATRAALGASWMRIAREMLTESVTIGMLGGALGVALAYAGLKLLISIGPQTLPRLDEISIDSLVLAFTLGVSLISGLLFGVIPVLKYAGPRLAESLRSGGRTLSHGRERHRARNTLVVVQVASALVLLIGAGLMIRTFQALRNIEPGFTNPEEIQILRISIPQAQVREPERVMRMENEMLDKLAAIPGVTSVAFASSAPMEGFNSNDLVFAEDKQYAAGEIPPIRRFRHITPRYFETIGTPLIAGRYFTWTDIYETRRVAIVSENTAKEMWGSVSSALGKRIRQVTAGPWREIVGVVGNVYDNGVHEKAPTFVYWPAMVDMFYLDPVRVTRGGSFQIRTTRAGTESFLAEARQAIWSVNANLPVFRVRTLKEIYDTSMARTSFTLVMLGIAGAMALVLGLVGLYGVISYSVSQRTREVGIRMALGAQTSGLIRAFVGQGLMLAAIGIVVGLGAAAALSRLMRSFLFNTSPLDLVTYAAVAMALVFVAVLASYIPARRVTAVNPVDALRAD